MRKLLLLLGLIAIAYPLELSARDLVKVIQSKDNRDTYYVWRDSIDKRGNIAYWTDEFVRYGINSKLEEHYSRENSGDCKNRTRRIQKISDYITGENFSKPRQLEILTPESVAYSILEYVCSSK